jgi:enterobacteria phage integrase
MGAMARPKFHSFPPYMTVDGDRGGYMVRNPLNNKKRRFAKAEEAKARASALLLAEWVDKERHARLLDAGKPTIKGVIEAWRQDELRFMPWSEGTANNYKYQFNKIERDLGGRLIARTDVVFLTDWIKAFCHTADSYNQWRGAFVRLYAFAVSHNMIEVNEADKILKRSNSLVIEANRKVRQPLDMAGFKEIRAHASPWLQIAMDVALVTLQGRSEVCNLRHTDFRGGFVFVIRQKTKGQTDAAFIKIKLTPDLEDLRSRSLQLDNSNSPFVIHRQPDRIYRELAASKEHWTYIRPDYLTKAFFEARTAAKSYDHLRPEERPTFHEIRGLGARTCELLGMKADELKILMAHADKKTTAIYLNGGAEALRDEDYVTVEAPLTLAQMTG